MDISLNITNAIVFVTGMFFGGAIVYGLLEWINSVTEPTSGAVDPKSRLGFDVSQRDRF